MPNRNERAGGFIRVASIAVAVVILTAPALILTGCGEEATTGKGEYSGRVRVSGSTTLLAIVQEAAVRFNENNPEARVDVQGGGSSTGLMQLREGVVDIANSSRELSGSELAANLVDHKIAFDIIAIVVNPKNPVRNLTNAQVRGIFTGSIRNWEEVGGDDKEIVVIIRDQASGTREMFDEKALGATKKKPVDSWASAMEATSNGYIQQVVATTPNAIGYLSYGFVDSSIKAISVDGVAPSVDNATAGKYEMARWLHMFTKGDSKGAAGGFIDYVLSPEFQGEVVSREYVEVEKVINR